MFAIILHNISFYSIFNQIKAAFVSIRDSIKKTLLVSNILTIDKNLYMDGDQNTDDMKQRSESTKCSCCAIFLTSIKLQQKV